MTSELERLRWLSEWTERHGNRSANVPIGIGDDAAAWSPPPGDSVVLSVDVQVEGVHFRREWLSPYELGRRAIDVSASDLAAMAARPGGVLLALNVSQETPEADFRELFRGLAERAREHDLAILGGNLSRGPLSISVTVVGSAPAERLLRRDGAREGDAIYVTGQPGRAGLGRALLERAPPERSRVEGALEAEAIRRFVAPQARLKEAPALREKFDPHAMIDLSDGLAADLSHVLTASAPGAGKPLGAILDRRALRAVLEGSGPGEEASDGFTTLASRLGLDPLTAVLEGGEDYELLFTASPRELAPREEELPVTQIGEIIAGAGDGELLISGDGTTTRWEVSGFDHYRGGA